MPERAYSRHAYVAILAAVEVEYDFAGWLTGIVAAVATHVGGIDELLQGRSGSWEAARIRDWMEFAGCDGPLSDHYQELAVRLHNDGGVIRDDRHVVQAHLPVPASAWPGCRAS